MTPSWCLGNENMRWEEIRASILSAKNRYEQERGIKTEYVFLSKGSEQQNWGIFIAQKTDGTYTLFFAYKHKRKAESGWTWFCPSHEHIEGLKTLIKEYETVEKHNKKRRR